MVHVHLIKCQLLRFSVRALQLLTMFCLNFDEISRKIEGNLGEDHEKIFQQLKSLCLQSLQTLVLYVMTQLQFHLFCDYSVGTVATEKVLWLEKT